jgi:hypothetical protein
VTGPACDEEKKVPTRGRWRRPGTGGRAGAWRAWRYTLEVLDFLGRDDIFAPRHKPPDSRRAPRGGRWYRRWSGRWPGRCDRRREQECGPDELVREARLGRSRGAGGAGAHPHAEAAGNLSAGSYLSTLRNYLDVPPGRYRVEAVFVYDDLGGWPDADHHSTSSPGRAPSVLKSARRARATRSGHGGCTGRERRGPDDSPARPVQPHRAATPRRRRTRCTTRLRRARRPAARTVSSTPAS